MHGDRIFASQDRNGDALNVYELEDPTKLAFVTEGLRNNPFLERKQILELHGVLGEWLAETPVCTAPQGLTEDRVRELIAEALKPVESEGYARYCETPGCEEFPGTERHFEHDPEPHEVGHPEPASACRCHDANGNSIDVTEPLCHRAAPEGAHEATRCTFCGWLWSRHSPHPGAPRQVRTPECGLCKQPWTDGHGQPGDPCADAPKQLVGCECGHRWGMHVYGFGCIRVLPGLQQCTCERIPPDAAANCTDCARGVHPHVFRSCPDCECVASAP